MPQKIGYLFKNMVLNILANSLLHAVLGEAEKQKVEKKKKKSTAFVQVSWFEQKKRTLPLKGQSPFIFSYSCRCIMYMKILHVLQPKRKIRNSALPKMSFPKCTDVSYCF